MSKDRIQCASVPVRPGDGYKPTTQVSLSVSYDKGRKVAYLSVYPCHVSDGCMSTMLFAGKLVTLEPMARLNVRRLQQLADVVTAQVAARAGQAWDVVTGIVVRDELTLVDPDTLAAAKALEGVELIDPKDLRF